MCVVGPGKRFLSGITYHTYAVADALSAEVPTSVVLLRQLLPSRLYPGAARVGADLSSLRLGRTVARFDGVDWWWLPSLLRALWFLRRQRPDVLLVQWWTAAALHTQLALALAARAMGARVVVELHEVIDPGEAERRAVRAYARLGAPLLMRLADDFVVHSDHDAALMQGRYRLPSDRVHVIPLHLFTHFDLGGAERTCPPEVCNILFFGVIRPYKGLEDLIEAFESLPDDEADDVWLTVVGETWESWTLPAERIAASPRRDRITFVNRFVTDEEVDAHFAGADVVALPYHRSSQSGPLHVAMGYGLPVVTTRVGGLPHAVEDYEGAVLVPPRSPADLAEGLLKAATLRGERFTLPPERNDPAAAYLRVLRRQAGLSAPATEPPSTEVPPT